MLLGLAMWHANFAGVSFTQPIRSAASVLGEGIIAIDGSIGLALGTAAILGLTVAAGAAMGLVSPMLRTNGTVAILGAAFGMLLYLATFVLLAPRYFPALEAADKPFWFLSLAFFGWLTGLTMFGSDVRRAERVIAVRAGTVTAAAGDREIRQVAPASTEADVVEPSRRS
jgi:hypothetical protein